MSKWRGAPRAWGASHWESSSAWPEAGSTSNRTSNWQHQAKGDVEATGPKGKGKGKSAGKGKSFDSAGKGYGKASSSQVKDVHMDRDKSRDLPVAIIGGGLSGLACGWALKQKGINAVIFDTGKHASGGRASSRLIQMGRRQQIVDHAVQTFTAQGAEVQDLVHRMEKDGALRRWQDTVGTIGASGKFAARDEKTQCPLWIGNMQHGIGSMAAWLASDQHIEQDVWVSKLRCVDSKAWSLLDAKGKQVGRHNAYSYIVMAHNGKCADRLIKTAPFTTNAHAALRCRFTPTASTSSDRLELSSLFVCVVEAPRGIAKFGGSFIEHHDTLSWVGNNSSKYPLGDAEQRTEVWTLVSTPQFGSTNKCPQENIPADVRETVTGEMCRAFASLIGADSKSWKVLHLQLWGAALPLNVCSQHFIHDAEAGVGVCGDWLTSPSVEGALFSGLALAEAIRRDLRGDGLASSSVKRFRGLVGSHALGSFGDCDTRLTAEAAVNGPAAPDKTGSGLHKEGPASSSRGRAPGPMQTPEGGRDKHRRW